VVLLVNIFTASNSVFTSTPNIFATSNSLFTPKPFGFQIPPQREREPETPISQNQPEQQFESAPDIEPKADTYSTGPVFQGGQGADYIGLKNGVYVYTDSQGVIKGIIPPDELEHVTGMRRASAGGGAGEQAYEYQLAHRYDAAIAKANAAYNAAAQGDYYLLKEAGLTERYSQLKSGTASSNGVIDVGRSTTEQINAYNASLAKMGETKSQINIPDSGLTDFNKTLANTPQGSNIPTADAPKIVFRDASEAKIMRVYDPTTGGYTQTTLSPPKGVTSNLFAPNVAKLTSEDKNAILAQAELYDQEALAAGMQQPLVFVQKNWDTGAKFKNMLGSQSYTAKALVGLTQLEKTGKAYVPNFGDYVLSQQTTTPSETKASEKLIGAGEAFGPAPLGDLTPSQYKLVYGAGAVRETEAQANTRLGIKTFQSPTTVVEYSNLKENGVVVAPKTTTENEAMVYKLPQIIKPQTGALESNQPIPDIKLTPVGEFLRGTERDVTSIEDLIGIGGFVRSENPFIAAAASFNPFRLGQLALTAGGTMLVAGERLKSTQKELTDGLIEPKARPDLYPSFISEAGSDVERAIQGWRQSTNPFTREGQMTYISAGFAVTPLAGKSIFGRPATEITTTKSLVLLETERPISSNFYDMTSTAENLYKPGATTPKPKFVSNLGEITTPQTNKNIQLPQQKNPILLNEGGLPDTYSNVYFKPIQPESVFPKSSITGETNALVVKTSINWPKGKGLNEIPESGGTPKPTGDMLYTGKIRGDIFATQKPSLFERTIGGVKEYFATETTAVSQPVKFEFEPTKIGSYEAGFETRAYSKPLPEATSNFGVIQDVEYVTKINGQARIYTPSKTEVQIPIDQTQYSKVGKVQVGDIGVDFSSTDLVPYSQKFSAAQDAMQEKRVAKLTPMDRTKKPVQGPYELEITKSYTEGTFGGKKTASVSQSADLFSVKTKIGEAQFSTGSSFEFAKGKFVKPTEANAVVFDLRGKPIQTFEQWYQDMTSTNIEARVSKGGQVVPYEPKPQKFNPFAGESRAEAPIIKLEAAQIRNALSLSPPPTRLALPPPLTYDFGGGQFAFYTKATNAPSVIKPTRADNTPTTTTAPKGYKQVPTKGGLIQLMKTETKTETKMTTKQDGKLIGKTTEPPVGKTTEPEAKGKMFEEKTAFKSSTPTKVSVPQLSILSPKTTFRQIPLMKQTQEQPQKQKVPTTQKETQPQRQVQYEVQKLKESQQQKQYQEQPQKQREAQRQRQPSIQLIKQIQRTAQTYRTPNPSTPPPSITPRIRVPPPPEIPMHIPSRGAFSKFKMPKLNLRIRGGATGTRQPTFLADFISSDVSILKFGRATSASPNSKLYKSYGKNLMGFNPTVELGGRRRKR